MQPLPEAIRLTLDLDSEIRQARWNAVIEETRLYIGAAVVTGRLHEVYMIY